MSALNNNIVTDILVRARAEGVKATANAVRSLEGDIQGLAQAERVKADSLMKGRAGVRQYQAQMNSLGMSFKNEAQNISMFRRNLGNLNQSLHNTQRAGQTTTATVANLREGQTKLTNVTQQGITKYQAFRTVLHSTRQGLMSLSQSWMSHMKNMQWTGRQLMVGITLPLYAVGTAAVQTFTKIEEEFTRLRKVLSEDEATDLGLGIEQGFGAAQGAIKGTYEVAKDTTYQTTAELGNIRDAVNDISAAYGAQQSIVTAVAADWAAAGFAGKNLIPIVDEVFRVSALGEVDVSVATKGMTQLINVFGVELDTTAEKVQNASNIINQFNAIENSTVLQMRELIEALPQVATNANLFGLSAAETAAALTAMKAAGIDANEGAHALKFGLQRMINPTNAAIDSAKAIKAEYGDVGQVFLDVMDGTIRGQDALSEFSVAYMELVSMDDLTAQRFLGDLVQKRQASRLGVMYQQMSAGVLEYRDSVDESGVSTLTAENAQNQWLKAMLASGAEGEEEINKINDALSDSAAQELQFRLDDPTIQIQRLRVQITGLAHDFVSAIWPTLQEGMKKIGEWIEKFKNMSDETKRYIFKGLAAFAALGPAVFAFAQVGLAFSQVFHWASRLLPKLYFVNQGMAEGMSAAELQARQVFNVGDAYGAVKKGIGGVIGRLKAYKTEMVATMALQQAFGEQAAVSAAAQMQPSMAGYVNQRFASTLGVDTVAMAAAKGGEDVLKARLGPGASIWAIIKAPLKGFYKIIGAPLKLIPGWTKMGDRIARTKIEMAALNTVDMSWRQRFVEGFRSSKGEAGKFRNSLTRIGDAFRGLKNKMVGFGPAVATAFAGARGESGRVVSSLKGLKGGFKSLAPAAASSTGAASMGLAGIGVSAGMAAGILAAVVAVVALVAVTFIALREHWDTVMAKMQPGLDALKDGWETLKDSASGIVDIFKDVFGEFDKGASSGEGFAATVGSALSGILSFGGKLLEWLAWLVDKMDFYWAWVARNVRNFVGLIAAIFSGDWSNIWRYAVQLIWNLFAKPIFGIIDLVIDGVLGLLNVLMNAIASAIGGLSSLIGKLPGVDDPLAGWESGIHDASDAVMEFANDVRLTAAIEDFLPEPDNSKFLEGIKDGLDEAEKEANDGGEEVAEELEEGFRERLDSEDPSDAISKWLGALKRTLDEQVSKLKEDAMKALEESHEARLAIFDARIDAIDEMEKKEKELYDLETYLNEKRKAREDFGLEVENYKRSRALAIYEGRIDDARTLDSEMLVANRNHKAAMGKLEEDRARDLLSKERDEQRERIKMRKDALAEILEAEKENFQERLDLLTRYTPRNIAQVQALIDGVSGLLIEYGVPQWSGAYTSAVGTWSTATELARADLEDQAYWSGEQAAQAFMDAVEGAAPGDGGGGDGGAAAPDAAAKPWESNTEMGNTFKQAFRNSGRNNDRERSLYNRALQKIADKGWRQQWGQYKDLLNQFFRSSGSAGSYNPPGTPDWALPGTYHTGGDVSGIMPREVPATLQSGEYVVQRSAAQRLGSGFLDTINQAHKYHNGGAVGSIPNFDSGGGVGNWSSWAAGDKGFGGLWSKMFDSFMNDGGLIQGNSRSSLEELFAPVLAAWGGQLAAGIPPGLLIGPLGSLLIGMFPGIGFSANGLLRPGAVTADGNPSDHGFGKAIDLSAPMTPQGIALMRSLFEHVIRNAQAYNLKQAIFEHDIWSNGTLSRGGFPRTDHFNHVHVAVWKALEQSMGSGSAAPSGTVKGYVKSQMARFGWGAEHWPALDKLIQGESSWNPTNENKSSGAWGLFQFMPFHHGPGRILPYGKNSNLGQQVQAGFSYIKGRSDYGNPTRAYQKWLSRNPHWYHGGGEAPEMMKSGGIVPRDNFAATLHKGEAVLPSQLTAALSAVSGKRYMTPAGMSMLGVSAGDGGGGGTSAFGGGDTYIHVDTFIGEEQWFTEMKKQYDMKTGGAKRRKHGTINRSVSSRMDNTVRYG